MSETMTSQVLAVAKEILGVTPSKEQHVSEIAATAAAMNKTLGLSKEVFETKLSNILNANSKSKTSAIVARVKNKQGGLKRGVYRLKRNAIGPTVKVNKVRAPAVNTQYAGTAGEYAVASQLLFWGFNVGKPFVDNGIDLTAEKNAETYFIQVKTCSVKDGENSFKFRIEQNVFESVSSKRPWYVFVMRSGNVCHFAILPNTQLSIWRDSKVIAGKDLSILIERDEKCAQYKLCGQDINAWIDDFGRIASNF